MALFLGVDPGANGAIVALDRAGKIVAAARARMTESDEGRARRPWAPTVFWAAIHGVTGVAIEEPIMFVGGKAAPKSIMAVALSAGAWLGMLGERVVTDRLYLVPPRTWQALLGPVPKGETKARAELLARGLWGQDPRLMHSRGFHDGLVDAALIAEWLRQKAIREGWA